MAGEWGEYHIYMAEPGYIAVRHRCGVWDQFPYFEGRTDLRWVTDWVSYHDEHGCNVPDPGG
jgi:hypothetical protein